MTRTAHRNTPRPSPYREPPARGEERADDLDADEALTAQVVAGLIVFVLICSLVRLYDPLFGEERFGKDSVLALLAAAVSGSYVIKAVVARCRRRLFPRGR